MWCIGIGVYPQACGNYHAIHIGEKWNKPSSELCVYVASGVGLPKLELGHGRQGRGEPCVKATRDQQIGRWGDAPRPVLINTGIESQEINSSHDRP